MKIAVLGFGWLGLPLGKSLLKAGHEVVGTTTSEEKASRLKQEGLNAVRMDLAEDLSHFSKEIFGNTQIAVLNFPPAREKDTTREYGRQALAAAALFPADTRFIFVSSTGIYPNDFSPATEAGFDRSKFAETDSIAFAEEALHLALGERLTIVRMAGLIGGDRHIGKYFAGKTGIPNGDTPVNLIYQTDCVRLIERIIEKDCWGEVFNGCASGHPSRRDYYTFSCEKFGLEKPEFPEEANPVIGKMIDNTKSKQVLDFVYAFDDPYQML